MRKLFPFSHIFILSEGSSEGIAAHDITTTKGGGFQILNKTFL
jgi:hypothetical protein